MYVTFAHPKYLLFLLAIPLFVLVYFLSLKAVRKRALSFANFEAIARIKGIDLFSKNLVIPLISILIIFLLTLTLSGLTLHIQKKASSFSFVLAIDSSRSMEAEDMIPNRLEAAKQVAIDFINDLPFSTKISIVSFSGNTFIEQGLTIDKDKMKRAIRGIEQSSIEGTDVPEAIITSTNLLKNEDSKAIILLSDGQITAGRVDYAIEYANDNDVLIHTIAIGTEEGGKTSYGLSKLDEDALKAISYNTGGEFFKVTNKKDLSESFNKIMTLTKKKVSIDTSHYLLIVATFLFIIEYILINTKYRALP